MAIDFEKEKARLAGLNKWDGNGTDGRYDGKEFEDQVMEYTQPAIMNLVIKEIALSYICGNTAELLNRAGVDEEFVINEDYIHRMLRGNMSDAEGTVFVSVDGAYSVFISMWSADESNIGCGIMILHETEKGVETFNGKEWVTEYDESLTGISRDIAMNVFGKKDGNQIEKNLLAVFPAITEPGSVVGIKEWKGFLRKQSRLIRLARKTWPAVSFISFNGNVYLVPKNKDNAGVLISDKDGEYTVWRFMSENDFLTQKEDDSRGDGTRVVYMEEAFSIKDIQDAERFVEAHMDRDCSRGKTLTIPVSEEIILHLDESALEDPGKILKKLKALDSEGTYSCIIKDLVKLIRARRRECQNRLDN